MLEETPSPLLDEPLREALTGAAVRLGEAAKYRSAGTVEFIFDEDDRAFYVLEVNTRLQVGSRAALEEGVCHARQKAGNNAVDRKASSLRLSSWGMVRLFNSGPTASSPLLAAFQT